MSITLPAIVTELLADPQTLRVLATSDAQGRPHVVYKGSLNVNDKGQLVYAELIESSQTNRNLTWSIWFKRPVAVNLLASDRRSYQIKGIPVKAHVSGPLFERYYREIREKRGDVDVSTVWVIEPVSVTEESYQVRQAEAEANHPLLKHLDRLTKPGL
jgi:hypothetical protein